jgi:hypothetical protein
MALPLCLLALGLAPLGHLPSDHERLQMVVTTGVPPGPQPHGVSPDSGREAHPRCLGCALGVGWSALLATHSTVLSCAPAGSPPSLPRRAALAPMLAAPAARGPPWRLAV